jgi:hypothetical protein
VPLITIGYYEIVRRELVKGDMLMVRFLGWLKITFIHEPDKAVNLKLLLYLFELMSGLKINFLKSGVFTINGDNNITGFYADMFNCPVGNLPIKYLGVPATFAALKTLTAICWMRNSSKKLAFWICDNASSWGSFMVFKEVRRSKSPTDLFTF